MIVLSTTVMYKATVYTTRTTSSWLGRLRLTQPSYELVQPAPAGAANHHAFRLAQQTYLSTITASEEPADNVAGQKSPLSRAGCRPGR